MQALRALSKPFIVKDNPYEGIAPLEAPIVFYTLLVERMTLTGAMDDALQSDRRADPRRRLSVHRTGGKKGAIKSRPAAWRR